MQRVWKFFSDLECVLSDRKCPKLSPPSTLLSRACFCLTLVIYTLLLTKLSEFKTKRNIKGSPVAQYLQYGRNVKSMALFKPVDIFSGNRREII